MSTIGYNEKEFYTKSYFTQLLCHYLCLTMEDYGINNYSSGLNDVYYRLNLTRQGLDLGGGIRFEFTYIYQNSSR